MEGNVYLFTCVGHVLFAPAQDHRAFLPALAFSPSGWDPLFQLPVPQPFVWHMASDGLWCFLATLSPE